jgi:hypothetical protein
LSGDLSNIVVAYGEQERGGPSEQKDASMRLPVYWVAERLGSGEVFQCAIESASVQDEQFLACLRLKREDFRDAVSIDTFRRRWKSFLGPHVRVVVYHQSTARLLRNIDAELVAPMILKSVKVDPQLGRGTLDDVVRSLGIEAGIAFGAHRQLRRAAE